MSNCPVHGGVLNGRVCPTAAVLVEVSNERERQFTQYGTNDDLLDGTGPGVTWLRPLASTWPADQVERNFRRDYELQPAITWMHLVREEVAEAFMEDDPVKLRSELIQVAALAVSWIEKLDARGCPECGGLGLIKSGAQYGGREEYVGCPFC